LTFISKKKKKNLRSQSGGIAIYDSAFQALHHPGMA